jgi:hypothetical protein
MEDLLNKLEMVEDFIRKKRNDEFHKKPELQWNVKHMTHLIKYVDEAIKTIESVKGSNK